MGVLGHVETPEGTLCPLTSLALRPPGKKARFTIRSGGGPELSCPNCSKGRHYLKDFQQTNPELYKIISEENLRIRRNYDKEEEEEEEEEEELEEREDEEEQVILDKKIHDSKYEYKLICDKIAGTYQAKVDNSPIKPTKELKESGSMIKNTVWKQYFPNVTQTNCPVCSQNAISFDNYSLGHIHPKSRCGSNSPNNLIPICPTCNTLMGTQHLYSYAWNVYSKVLW